MKIKKGQFLKYTTKDNAIFIVLVNEVYFDKYKGTIVLSDSQFRKVGDVSTIWRTDIDNMEREGLHIEIIETDEKS
jgi:hypothetical protein